MRDKYFVCKASSEVDQFGNNYPDIFTLPIENFAYTTKPQKYYLTSRDIYRFDLLMQSYYSTPEYEDIILWLNNITHISLKTPGETILLPSMTDIENFYRKNY